MTKANKFKIKGIADDHPAQKEFDKYMKAKRKIAPQIRIWIAIESKLPNDVFTMAQISKETNTSWVTARHIFHDIESLKRIKKYGKIGKAVLYQRLSK
jgi:hypothetical protein